MHPPTKQSTPFKWALSLYYLIETLQSTLSSDLIVDRLNYDTLVDTFGSNEFPRDHFQNFGRILSACEFDDLSHQTADLMRDSLEKDIVSLEGAFPTCE